MEVDKGETPWAGNQQVTIESLKAELAKSKESLASMQKAKERDTKYAKIRREASVLQLLALK